MKPHITSKQWADVLTIDSKIKLVEIKLGRLIVAFAYVGFSTGFCVDFGKVEYR